MFLFFFLLYNSTDGADCSAKTPWFGVRALFGYYRVPIVDSNISTTSTPTTFERCLFPGACLGARNLEFAKMYFATNDATIDLALTNPEEGCNTKYGFKTTSRLCHTCGKNWRRDGLHQCKSCPQEAGLNYVFIVLGIIVAAVVLVVLVKMTIDDAGKTKLSESIQKCILNYFQVATLFSSIPLRWPQAMQTFFEIQGAFSTIGEHLVNPDCTATNSSAADLFYAKQIAYLISPILLIFIVYIIWKLYALKTGQEWHRTHENIDVKRHTIRSTVNIKDKFVVTVCVLIYLFYPTLCKQAFGLFTCYEVKGKRYLLADLQEVCWQGRHSIYVGAVGIPQLLIFVVGLPVVGLYFLFRNRRRLDTVPVKARYGLFFGGYKEKRYYWEFFLVDEKLQSLLLVHLE